MNTIAILIAFAALFVALLGYFKIFRDAFWWVAFWVVVGAERLREWIRRRLRGKL